MKNKFKKFFKNFQISVFLIINRIKHKIQGYQTTEKGKLLLEYLSKVILEDYKPQTMADYTYEKAFNPDGLIGKERQIKAGDMFLILLQFYGDEINE